MRLRSSGSVTSVQSKSSELDLDFLDEDEDLLLFRELLLELCLELPAMAVVSFAASIWVEDLFRLCRWWLERFPTGSDLVRRGVSPVVDRGSDGLSDCSSGTPGDALWMRIKGGDLSVVDGLGDDIYGPRTKHGTRKEGC
jgi:hypothetical protein